MRPLLDGGHEGLAKISKTDRSLVKPDVLASSSEPDWNNHMGRNPGRKWLLL